MSKELLGLLSIAFSFAGDVPYVLSILKGTTRPHMFSWTIWGILGGITFAAQWVDGAGPGSWMTGYGSVTCFVFASLAYRATGDKGITRSDRIMFCGALAAIPLWYLTRNPEWSVILATVIGAAAQFMTMRKAYHHPYDENVFSFAMFAATYYLAFAALTHYSVTTVAFPCFYGFANTLFVPMLLWRRRRLGGRPAPL